MAMMIQRRRHRSPATPDRQTSTPAKRVRPKLGNELFAQIAAGARSFEVGDRNSIPSVETFQDHVRALESLVAAGLITIGARETPPNSSDVVLAVRRIRLTEAGKRRIAAGGSSRQPSDAP
jgi:hypothetical protein